MNRRNFLALLAAAPAGALAQTNGARGTNPSQDELWTAPRELWITRPETQERGRFTYWENGAVVDSQYFEICRLMRDVRSDEQVAMHIGLLNFQYAIQKAVSFYFGARPFILTDAHRTKGTNARIENAAQDSQHLHGAANDGRYEGVEIKELYKVAAWFDTGGVGLYPSHVHVDAGRTRRWSGSYGAGKGRK